MAPPLSPMDCHLSDIDLAKLKLPRCVHFGVVLNDNLGCWEPNRGRFYQAGVLPIHWLQLPLGSTVQ